MLSSGDIQSRFIKKRMETVLLILIGVLSRLLPHPANMTAVGGVAIYSGAKIDTKKALIITFGTMFLSDAVIGFHSLMWATYGSLMVAVLVGRCVGPRTNVQRIFGGTLAASVIFFIITNFAVWAATPLYVKTLSGFIDCYIMALPFFRNSVIGDFGYTFIIFGSLQFILYGVQRIHMVVVAKKQNEIDRVYA